MKIKDIYGDITIHTRKGSPSDKLVVEEIFHENVYHLRDDMFQGGVVLDIGANIGAFTIEVLRRAKHNGKPVTIYAVEPEPHNLKLLHRNLRANKHLMEDSVVHVVPFAVGGSNSLVHITNEHGGSRVAQEGSPVPMMTLDSFIQNYKIKSVDFAKFDTEGSEVPTLLNCSDATIDMMRYTAIEFDEANGLFNFAELINRFARKCSIQTLGVPARGCYIYTERHMK